MTRCPVVCIFRWGPQIYSKGREVGGGEVEGSRGGARGREVRREAGVGDTPVHPHHNHIYLTLRLQIKPEKKGYAAKKWIYVSLSTALFLSISNNHETDQIKCDSTEHYEICLPDGNEPRC